MQEAKGQVQRVDALFLDEALGLGMDLQQLEEQPIVLEGRLQTRIEMAASLARLILACVVGDSVPVQAIEFVQQLFVAGGIRLLLPLLCRPGGLDHLCQFLAGHGREGHGLFLTVEGLEHLFGLLVDHHQGLGGLAEIEHVVAKPDIQKLLAAAL